MTRPKTKIDVDLGFFTTAEPDPQPQITTTASAPEPRDNNVETSSAERQEEPLPKPALVAEPEVEPFAPTIQEIEADPITSLAQEYWNLAETEGEEATIRFDHDVVELVWREHLEKSSFALRKVMLLEFSQYLEKYLWPSFVAKGKARSSLAHVLSIVVMVNEKFRQCMSGVWDIFADDATKFSGLISRVLRAMVEPVPEQEAGVVELNLQARRFLLIFLIHLFQSLENSQVRNECMRLINISSWSCVLERTREQEFRQHPERRPLWERAEAKYNSTSKASAKERMEFDRTFISKLIRSFFDILYSIPASGSAPPHAIPYCERFIEFMIDLEAQLPTRRHFNLLLHDHLIVPISETSNLAERGRQFLQQINDLSLVVPANWGGRGSETGVLFVRLLDQLKYYAKFEINDFTGAALTASDITHAHYERIRHLQKLAFMKFRDSLEDFALANVGSVDSRDGLLTHFGKLDEAALRALCEEVGIRTRTMTADREEEGYFDQQFLTKVLVATYEKRHSQVEAINSLPLYPDENFLFDDTAVPTTKNFTNTHCLPIPKLNLQFLTIHDYLLRNFTLFRLESNYEIRQDVEDVVQRLAPQHNIDRKSGQDETVFSGWARMAVPIETFQIVDVGTPKLGENKPSVVKADVAVNIQRYTDSIRKEWDSLRPHDVLFLLTIQMEPDMPGWAELEANKRGSHESAGSAFRRRFGLKYVRGCEVTDIIGDDGQPVDSNEPLVTGFRRTWRVSLDPNQYKQDMDRLAAKESEDVYPTFNILMRRRPQENNFKAVLDTIRDLMQSDLVVPAWLHNIFLGYGDRSSAHYTKMPDPVRTIDFRDTFMDWDHLRGSFPDKRVTAAGKKANGEDAEMLPPYVLTFPESMFAALANAKSTDRQSLVSAAVKRKLQSLEDDGEQAVDRDDDSLLVRTYKPPNMGPYPEDTPKKNTVRFTPTQVEAIHAGSSPGLTMIVGPPGTGKTDVAVQIIANLYHNYPEQHTLIITHSNTALNQLFEKIAALDIDARHILRLGHGQEELDLENAGSWGKYGRVNAFLEKRLELLREVDRLAQSLQIPGAHGYTCETAGYFFTYHVLSRWEPYIHKVRAAEAQGSPQREDVTAEFPFDAFFADAPQSLFPENISFEEVLDIAEGCWRHIRTVFDGLEEIRAFELLRTTTDRSNYLLVKEAKIIAMTCTHAALKRREFVQLGFKYDNVIMEEAGQILEVETFVPLLLQNPDPDTGASRLKRVVLIGDHNQLPPVVKNMAFQRYGNMEQSLFTRFVRLGIPTIQLDAQGRSRPSLAELFRWKYDNLGDLQTVKERPEFNLANPGFSFDYQVINVPAFMGKGETEPRPHYLQNLGEAEYVVATYQYMRLLGYPAERISILTTYNGQRDLIMDVLEKRCSWNPLYGNPHKVATVDKYQGQQNDYVLLSLVRTKTVGHLRDVRRLIVAMSRARLGLYVFCRVPLFQGCYELQPVFQKLLQRPSDKLWLRGGERYNLQGFARKLDDTGLVRNKKGVWIADKKMAKANEVFEISGVEHMGQYVHQMMQEQVEWLKNRKKMQDDAGKQAAGVSESGMQAMDVDDRNTDSSAAGQNGSAMEVVEGSA